MYYVASVFRKYVLHNPLVWCNSILNLHNIMMMKKIKWSEKVTNEQVLDSIGEKRTLLNNILSRKAIALNTHFKKKLRSS